MFTPAGPPANNQLVPWICLVVVPVPDHQASPIAPGTAAGLPQLHTTRAELPPLLDAWAWAHAQVMGPRGDVASIEKRLSAANPAINLSRLCAPADWSRRRPTSPASCPPSRPGAKPVSDCRSTRTRSHRRGTTTTRATPRSRCPCTTPSPLPPASPATSRRWRNGSCPRVRRLVSAWRTLDTSEPGGGVPPIANGPGREMIVEGPVVSLASTEGDPQWPSPADQVWPAEKQTALRDRLNARQNQAHQIDPETQPTVGPPLYASAHINHDALDAQAPGWFAELNGDPRNRVRRRPRDAGRPERPGSADGLGLEPGRRS